MQFGKNAIGNFFGPDSDLIMNTIVRGEVWDAHVMEFLVKFLNGRGQSSVLALDVGANLGQFAIAFSKHFSEVIAFEPDSYLRAILEVNINLNNCENIEVLSSAVWNASNIDLSFPEPDGRYASLGSYGIRPDLPSKRFVPSIAIDDLNLTHVDFVKIDIQGADLNAMLGMRDTIERCQPVICFEFESGLAGHFGQAIEDYMTFIEKMNYRVISRKFNDFLIGPSV